MIFPIKTKIAFLGVSQFSDTPESVQSACFETTSQHVVATLQVLLSLSKSSASKLEWCGHKRLQHHERSRCAADIFGFQQQGGADG